MFRALSSRRAKALYATAAVGAGWAYWTYKTPSLAPLPRAPLPASHTSIIELDAVPTRQQQVERLKAMGARGELLDVLVIGGGATGTGIALDAVTRGLSVGLVERADFASGTSSRSTKLIHGGVRYLEKAFKNLDMGQLELVSDALHERKHMLSIAPYLSRPLPIIVPLYNDFPSVFFWAPYYYLGVKAYDLVAGRDGLLLPSFWLSANDALSRFPQLRQDGLKGGIVYYDGQQNDSRMNLSLALTAAAKGAAVTNYVEVVRLLKGDAVKIAGRADEARVIGAVVRDRMTGDEFNVYAKHVVNATGPFCDAVRSMANDRHQKASMISPSSGVHLILSKDHAPDDLGLIVPSTDGRVLFMLPWEGSTLAGTTDAPTSITPRPEPHEDEVDFILREVSRFMEREVRREDVDAAWSGIRPLAKDPHATDTASASRDHIVEVTAPGVITITGGKWTTYRKMAQDAVDKMLSENAKLAKQAGSDAYKIDTSRVSKCQTPFLPLIGTAGWSIQLATNLQREGLPEDVAQTLSSSYGDKAVEVAKIAVLENKANRLADGYGFIEAEVLYGMRHEYAMTAVDVIGNRTRLSFLNSAQALAALPRVIDIMAEEGKWDTQRKIAEFRDATRFLATMNVKPQNWVQRIGERVPTPFPTLAKRALTLYPEVLSYADLATLRTDFESVDGNRDGVVSKAEVESLIERSNSLGLAQLRSDASARQRFFDDLKAFAGQDAYELQEVLLAAATSWAERAPKGSKVAVEVEAAAPVVVEAAPAVVEAAAASDVAADQQ